MERLDFHGLEADADTFDDAATNAVGLDDFCSSTNWVIPAREAFQPEATPFVFRGEHGWAAFSAGVSPAVGRYLLPLEAAWGLACPIITHTPERMLQDVVQALTAYRAEWSVALIAGMDTGGPLWRFALGSLWSRFRIGMTDISVTHVASLDGGFDGFLSRRSRKFRAGLRSDERRIESRGVTFERVGLSTRDDVDAWYGKVLAIERKSWKSLQGFGADTDPMRTFTHNVLRRSAEREGSRLIVARLEGEDVGYIHGAIYRGRFRGLQMSFDANHAGLGLGNMLQASMIRWLCDDRVQRYDLGSDLDYKRRWAEQQIERRGLVVTRK